MKKIILLALCVFVLMSIFGTVCFATELETAEEMTEEMTEEMPEEIATENTIFTRIWEFVTKYKGEVLSIVGDTGIVAVVSYVLFRFLGFKKVAGKDMEKVKELSETTVKNQTDIINVVNKLIESYNLLADEHEKLKATYEKYETEEAERNKAISVMTLELNALLEIISSVYVNSKLPQSIKDMVAVKYSKCLKAIETDETLSAILKSVQSALTKT